MRINIQSIWALTGLLITGFPLVNFIYWPQVLKAGVLPPQADSIAIPMFGSVFLALIASPAMVCITWICSRRYNPTTSFMAWRRDRPIRTAIFTTIFGGTALFVAVGSAVEIRLSWPWYEYLWLLYGLLLVVWLLALRAAAVEQLSTKEM